MSLLYTEGLLRQYNKRQPITTTSDNTDGDRFFSDSYLNKYDALYDKYKDNKNFNVNMWQEAFKKGDQDSYLAFLEQNKDTQMSEQFYDSQYYDYETMMLELYKPFADGTNEEERKIQVYDATQNKYVEQSLGKMSDQQFIEYQLNAVRDNRKKEITRKLEQDRKDQMSWFAKFGHDVAATFGEFGEGVLTGLAGIVDVVAAPFYATDRAIGGEDWLDAFVDYFGSKGLTAAEKASVREALDEYERLNTHFRDIDGEITGVGKYVAGIANSIGMMVPAIVANALTGGAASLSWLGTATFYTSIFSGNMYDNANNPNTSDSPSWLKITNAAIKTGAEVVVEWGLGKLLGGTIQNAALGLAGKSGLAAFKGVSKTVGINYLFKSAAQEGLEEFLQDFSTNLVDKFTDMIYEGYGNTGVTFQTLIDSFCIGVLSSIFMSSGQVAFRSTSSAIRNKIEPGSGDLLIETKDGPQKVKGFTKLYYSSILSDFQKAIKDLRSGKLNVKENIKLAQEVYAAMSVISQYYSSFSADRVKLCETLLNRVINAETDTFAKDNARAASILSPDTVSKIVKSDKDLKSQVKTSSREEAKTFSTMVDITFRSMVGGTALRHADKIKKVAEDKESVLKENGVTQVTGAIDTDGVQYKKDPEMAELEERLGKKAANNIEELRKGYELIITTDGHIAVEQDGYLFVSEAWLQNYTSTEIYKYLEQTKILETLATEKSYAPMIKKLIAFDKEFTGQKDVNAERALMDLLFNKSVYQAFLLSHSGENVHEFKAFIFQLHDIIKSIAKRSAYHQQQFKGKQSEKRKNLLEQIYQKIKDTMREPTLKAVLNWHLDPQLIGADSVLTPRDIDVVNQYEHHRRVLANMGKDKDSSAYENLAEDIIKAGKFNDEELALIHKVIENKTDVTDKERTLVRALLDEADCRMTTYDFERLNTHIMDSLSERLIGDIGRVSKIDDSTTHEFFNRKFITWKQIAKNIMEEFARRRLHLGIFSTDFQTNIDNITHDMYRLYEGTFVDNGKTNTENLKELLTKLLTFINKEVEHVSNTQIKKRTEVGLGAFTIPYQAISALNENNIAEAQMITDALNEFEHTYGISFRELIIDGPWTESGVRTDISKFTEEIPSGMSYLAFAIKKLESMLNNKYVVVIKYKDDTRYDFSLVKQIPAETLLSRDILNEDIDTRNVIFRQMFIMDKDSLNTFYKNIAIIASNPVEAEKYGKYILDYKNYDTQVLNGLSRGVAPDGEVFYDMDTATIENQDLYTLYKPFLKKVSGEDKHTLDEFIDISQFPSEVQSKLKNISILFGDCGMAQGGFDPENDTITISSSYSSDYFATLVHETNHALQKVYDLPGGFSPKAAFAMPEFLAYVVNNYTQHVNYVLRREGYADFFFDNKKQVSAKDITTSYAFIRDSLSFCAYKLVQGEIWARSYSHNAGPVRGFVFQELPNGGRIISPDGKKHFDFRFAQSSQSKAVSTKVVADSAIDVSMQKLFILKSRQEREGYKSTSRDTYHSYLTKGSSTEITQEIMNPDLPLFTRYTVRLDDIIKNPAEYLSPEIIAMCKGDLSEGNVFYRLKEYVEENHKGVSIDRKDNTHEYIWVDDNAFDDLLLTSIKSKMDGDDTSLVQKYGTGERIPLTKFYSEGQLAKLGIHPNTFVVIASNVVTETRFDDKHRVGAIFIKAEETTTDSVIIDKLNHEFRHVLQYYNGFETGFTPNFKVSKEMIADVKNHVPGLFTNESIVRWAKTLYNENWEEAIVQRFVYFSVGGELNAYGFRASELYGKPTFVNKEAGNPTIFLPWYDPQTGEGRHKTEFLAMRADDTKTDKPDIRLTLPNAKKGPKYTSVEVDSIEDTTEKTYAYDTRRDFSNEKAKGTNLKYFIVKGQRNQMDPDLQDFVIATTGHEDKLPEELVYAITHHTLTKQGLFKWFRQVDAKKINDFTFDLLNKYIFKNNYINNMRELNAIIARDPSFYWAAAQVLRKEGLSLEALVTDNDADKFLAFINSVEGSKWKEKIAKKQTEFNTQWIEISKGNYKKEDIDTDYRIDGYMRVFAMQWFDGTLAGAFYMANAYRKTARKYEEEQRGVLSINAKRKGEKEDAPSAEDSLTERNKLSENDSVGNDIIAIYEASHVTTDDMIKDLIKSKYSQKVEDVVNLFNVSSELKDKMRKKLGNYNEAKDYFTKLIKKEDLTNVDKVMLKGLKSLFTEITFYQKALSNMTNEEIAARYADVKNAELTDTKVPEAALDTKAKQYKQTRVDIVGRIKRSAKSLLKLVNEGKVKFTDLPQEVQDMFQFVDATTETGKKTQVRELKSEAYSVGRGRNTLPGETDKISRLNYVPKHDVTKGNEAFRHDTSAIRANDELLRNTLDAVKKYTKQKDNTIKKAVTRGEEASRTLASIMRTQNVPKEKRLRETEFKVKKREFKLSDKSNIFNIISGTEIPHVLYGLLDKSFEEFADTEVQFASRDKSGQLYDKTQFKKGEFDSRVKHEVSNWDAFYEANRETLLSLTRKDILDIVEFFQKGASTIDGPANKLAAFEIFLLGYIVDGARHNFNNWNFSDAEIEMIEKLYEAKASAHGSGLNAVQQMIKVVDPLRKVRQRMFDDWDAISDHDKDELIAAVDNLQNEKDAELRKIKAKNVQEMLKDFGKRQRESDKLKTKRWSKGWWRNLGGKVKSYRYMSMLSSPMTWIRNVISNVIITGFNKTSDVIGRIIFAIPKKGYREEQWNLNNVKISTEVKAFIDENILKNPVFKPLYDMTNKYDPRPSKNKTKERNLLVSLIAKAYEKQYAKENRFDSKVMKNVSKFIDKMISDEYFVKFVAGRYFGKMLTLEMEKGKIDLSKGLTDEVADLFAESVIMANVEYMHKRSFMADMLDGIRDKRPALYEALTFWQPFLNSSFNWFAEAFKYTPFGLANSIVRACRLEKQITKLDERRAAGEMVMDSRAAEFFVRRDIGKGVLGLLLSCFGIWLALSGRIRIDEDDEKFYMYIDEDIKLDITNLFGSSSVLVGASIAQLWVEQKDGDTATFEEMISLVTDTMLDGFFATDILERHKWGGTWDDLLTETESVMRSFVPQMWQTIIACTNQYAIRYSPGFKGMWERWLNTFVPTQPFGNRKINPYTGELEDKYSLPIIGALLQKGVLGPKIYWVEVSELERMCRELGVNKNELTGELTVNGEKFELDRLALNEKYGELNKESLEKIKSQKHNVQMPNGNYKTLSWDNMTDEQRARVISRTMIQNAEYAKIYMWTQVMNKKFYTSYSTLQTLRKLGITKNVYLGDKGFLE